MADNRSSAASVVMAASLAWVDRVLPQDKGQISAQVLALAIAREGGAPSLAIFMGQQ